MSLEKVKVLITGCSGLVGSYFLRLFGKCNLEIYLTQGESKIEFDSGKIISMDLRDGRSFLNILNKLRPTIIINFAAYTDVDGCEINRTQAKLVNADLVKVIANYILTNDSSYLLHISTDYVFDGKVGNYAENDLPNPINWYGSTKLSGETEIKNILPKEQWSIARISTPFGLHDKKQSFPVFVISNLRAKKSIKVLTDQYTSPIYAGTLSKMLSEIIESKFNGVINLACKVGLSRYQQALNIADTFGLDADLINRISMNEISWKAKRPMRSTLNTDKALKTLKNKVVDFASDLLFFQAEFDSYYGKFQS